MKEEDKSLFATQLPVAQPMNPLTDPSIVAAAEAVKARIQSMYLMAYHNPRNPDQARDSILRACKRTAFAEKVEFSKPVGGRSIKGPSVRFAETALKEWGNVLTETQIIYEDDMTRRSKVFCTDLQTNVTYSKEIVVTKTVERKKPTEDREVLATRTNIKGEKVYIVRATEDEMQNKESALISKAFRNEGLRLIPTDIVEEALDTARQTLKSRDEKDPDASKRQMLDAFSSIGVRPKEIEAYLKHSLDSIVPAELSTLRAMYRAIKDGEATWKEYMEREEGEKPEVDPALIVKFDKESSDRKVDQNVLHTFLSEIAGTMEWTVEQVKVEALKELPKFWKQYEVWAAAPARKKENKNGELPLKGAKAPGD